MHRRRAAALLLAAAVTVLTACSSGDHAAPHDASPSASATSTGAAADVAFAQLMVPHHEQAVAMADLALDPKSGTSRQVRTFAEQIKAAQDPEIQQMVGWLQQWGAPTAMPSASDHSGHDMGGVTAHGMMTDADMTALAQASGAAFVRMWLQLMIDHHEGAIEMAEQVKGHSSNPEVVNLANAIITTQVEEIDEMEKALS